MDILQGWPIDDGNDIYVSKDGRGRKGLVNGKVLDNVGHEHGTNGVE